MPGPLKLVSTVAPSCLWLSLHQATDLLEGRGQHGGELARPGDSTAGHWVSLAIYSSLGPTEPQLHL